MKSREIKKFFKEYSFYKGDSFSCMSKFPDRTNWTYVSAIKINEELWEVTGTLRQFTDEELQKYLISMSEHRDLMLYSLHPTGIPLELTVK